MTEKKITGNRELCMDDYLTSIYGSRWSSEPIPKNEIPEHQLSPDVAYRIVSDEMNLNGNPALNLATFVTTWMEPEADKLIKEAANKNLIDEDEYPQLKVIEDRLIRMQANLFNVPKDCDPCGACTIGSSEAIMLGLLAHKWTWRKKMKAAGKDYSKPNIVFGAGVHTCWEKFTRYFDVEMRIIPMQTGKYTINSNDIEPLIDENTIAVGVVVGTTFTGQVDDVAGINKYLLKLKKEQGLDIPIHVDAASGGFIMPFIDPKFKWDFRLEQVRSINVSNHKYGMVYAGLGSIIFKDKSDLPEDLPFEINYLGGTMYNYSLNFSKSSSMLLAQYYMFLRLGKKGYKNIIRTIMSNAQYLEEKLMESKYFDLLTDTKYLPVVVVKLKDSQKYSAYEVSDSLRKFGWIVPAYALPANAQDTVVLRMVVKENFSRTLVDKFAKDILTVIEELEQSQVKASAKSEASQSSSETNIQGIC